jgi:hypothetical protein
MSRELSEKITFILELLFICLAVVIGYHLIDYVIPLINGQVVTDRFGTQTIEFENGATFWSVMIVPGETYLMNVFTFMLAPFLFSVTSTIFIRLYYTEQDNYKPITEVFLCLAAAIASGLLSTTMFFIVSLAIVGTILVLIGYIVYLGITAFNH